MAAHQAPPSLGLSRQEHWRGLPAKQETHIWCWIGKIPWRRERLPSPVFWPGEFHDSINGNPLQCSCLENPRDRGAWWATVYGVAQSRTQLKQLSSSSSSIVHVVAKSRTRLSNFHFTSHVNSTSINFFKKLPIWCIVRFICFSPQILGVAF